jgi:hypothetical protein
VEWFHAVARDRKRRQHERQRLRLIESCAITELSRVVDPHAWAKWCNPSAPPCRISTHQICVKHKLMPKRRKRGRPATGHDPILGVRVPAKVIRKIDLLGEALSMDRSATVRRLLERGLDYDSYLLRATKGKGVTDEVVSIWAELEKARAAEVAANRAKRRKDKVAAEINAHRATAKADEISSALADRIALQNLQNANKTPAPSRPGGPPAAVHKQPPRGARRLSEAEIKAAADRAEARSRLLHTAVIVEDESEPAAPSADRRHT